MQKLRLLTKSLDFRYSEFPNLREAPENSEGMQSNGSDAAKGSAAKSPPRMPKPAAVTGTLTVKLLGAEGLLDAATIIGDRPDMDIHSPVDRHTRSATYAGPSPHSQTLPGRSSHGAKDPTSPLSPGSSGGAGTSTMGFARRGSKHLKSALANRHSGEVVEEVSLGESLQSVLELCGECTDRMFFIVVLVLHEVPIIEGCCSGQC